ncbi:hypothetical protein DH2020_039677 [Rehmannia glutinosa]|uniref:Srp40 C-terminal domain-containing protein n=1 Tax=Rehmannia glutinosa TaxID=99300 RepID=A0ABR0UX65_REHGL
MRGSTDVSPSSSSLIAFKPRQVLLLEQQQQRNPAVSTRMAKTRPENPAQLSTEDESILTFSVALWLENKGFSKVLKRFVSAAQIQDDNWKARALNLNEIFSKYQEICNSAREQVKFQKQQEEQVDVTKETNGDENHMAFEQIGSKKKKKKSKGDATVAETGRTSEAINEKTNESYANGKEDQSYKTSDGLSKDLKSKVSKESNGEEVFELTVDQSTKKQKDKKKKKSKLITQSLDADEKQIDVIPAAEVLDRETTTDKKSKKKSVEAAEDGVNESKKASKKRKRMATNENENQSGEEVAVEESKSKKSKGLEEGKDVLANGHAGEQNKEENSEAGQVGSQNFSTKQTNGSIKSAINNNGLDKSSQQKSARGQRNSSRNKFAGVLQPKTVNAFQRVKVEEVEFVDERLQDNSYWAKDGAETGYGAKAQEVLGQVKGRDFRHEKTKKKRGSYRGGQIDLHSHSIKFNYSDEE